MLTLQGENLAVFAQDTIVAPATPLGEGGIGVVRLSGSDAEKYLQRLFRPSRGSFPLKSHRLYHGHFFSWDGRILDEVLAVIMREPRSYTREDVVEIHSHGAPYVVKKISESFVRVGARMAFPGEFTQRAFLHGRLDLSRAEAVIDLIRARSEKSVSVALQQLQGGLGRSIMEIRENLSDLLALIEADLDFPEEEVPSLHMEGVRENTCSALQKIGKLSDSFEFGRIAREGLGIILVGRPNVGKSSLLNALLGEDRAIVSEIPGTTRDTIEEGWSLEGFPLRLIDTAGIHNSHDPLETEGMRRTQEKIQSADLLLLVVDGSREPGDDDFQALAVCSGKPTLLILNKSDLGTAGMPPIFSDLPFVSVSARTGGGLEQLKRMVIDHVAGDHERFEAEDSTILSSRRHWESLLRCRESLERFQAGLEVSPWECLSVELRDAIQALGEITGETLSENVLKRIFNRFCIGK